MTNSSFDRKRWKFHRRIVTWILSELNELSRISSVFSSFTFDSLRSNDHYFSSLFNSKEDRHDFDFVLEHFEQLAELRIEYDEFLLCEHLKMLNLSSMSKVWSIKKTFLLQPHSGHFVVIFGFDVFWVCKNERKFCSSKIFTTFLTKKSFTLRSKLLWIDDWKINTRLFQRNQTEKRKIFRFVYFKFSISSSNSFRC